ncbi:MAG: hypothetical protein ABSC20_01285 [Candidatus Bathyarchaeia archaeon]|jgi:hypothetical protein
MPEEIVTVVKIPLSEIEQSIRDKHLLPARMVDAKIEGQSLVLHFAEAEETVTEPFERVTTNLTTSHSKQRRQRKKRNRMKTRGWAVVGRITNTKGQKCSIYKPFVDALQVPNLSDEERRKKVESILRSNRNRPSDESVNYFLENTLEFLKSNHSNSHNSEVFG